MLPGFPAMFKSPAKMSVKSPVFNILRTMISGHQRSRKGDALEDHGSHQNPLFFMRMAEALPRRQVRATG
ncbi:hypothetical protein ACCT09_32830, partial [Rhizobium ruizarguesonis]